MRNYVAPILSTLMMASVLVAATGCPPPPPPPPPPQPAAPPPEPERPRFQVSGGQLQLPGPVVFETGKDILKPESDDVLKVVKDYMEEKKDITLLRVEGHTDSDGDDRANAESHIQSMCEKLLANPVIEDFHYEIVE